MKSTAREPALATLAAVASSPDAVGASTAHLMAAIDALVIVHATADQSAMSGTQAACRSPRAVWAAVFSHAENRIKNLKIAEEAAKARAA
jgi:hypothetical protein